MSEDNLFIFINKKIKIKNNCFLFIKNSFYSIQLSLTTLIHFEYRY